MNLQTFNLENSSVLNEEELVVLLGGGFAENEVITQPGDKNAKCNNCDKCHHCS